MLRQVAQNMIVSVEENDTERETFKPLTLMLTRNDCMPQMVV